MRKIQTSDVFAAMRLIRRAKMREEIKPFLKLASTGELSVEDIGIEGIIGLLEMVGEKQAEQGIYEVLSGPFEIATDEVAKLELDALIENLQALAKENDLKRFFTLLVDLMSTK